MKKIYRVLDIVLDMKSDRLGHCHVGYPTEVYVGIGRHPTSAILSTTLVATIESRSPLILVGLALFKMFMSWNLIAVWNYATAHKLRGLNQTYQPTLKP